MKPCYLFMGGTFDPIHNGHLRMATEVREVLGTSLTYLMPTPSPVHKELKGANVEHRLAMLELVVELDDGLMLDTRELKSERDAYTILSLEHMRAELGENCSICMLIGMDSLLTIDTWRRYEELLNLCNLVAVGRPGSNFSPNKNVQALIDKHRVETAVELTNRSNGGLLLMDTCLLDISSTDIRSRIKQKKSIKYLVPDTISDYIDRQKLYIN